MDLHYVVAYDVVADGFSGMRLILPLVWLVALLVGGCAAVAKFRRRDYNAATGVGVLVALWGVMGGVGFGNVVRQQLKCIHQAKAGDFDVVEGEVRDYVPQSEFGKGYESFTVNGVAFRYSDNDLSLGGFHNTAHRGGPVRPGLHARIAHRDGRILRLEIRQ